MIEERNKEKVGSLYKDLWDQFKKHKGALFGGAVFLLIVISVIVGPFLWPFEANAIASVIFKRQISFSFQYHS